MAIPSDGSFEPEADAVDTLNELSLSQAVLEEAPLPDTSEQKILEYFLITERLPGQSTY